MKLKTISRGRAVITTPNGTRLLYAGDRLRAAVVGNDLYVNFDDPDRNDRRVSSTVSRWSSEYGVSGGGERTESEIVELALRPVSVNYGDYSRNQSARR